MILNHSIKLPNSKSSTPKKIKIKQSTFIQKILRNSYALSQNIEILPRRIFLQKECRKTNKKALLRNEVVLNNSKTKE